MELNKAQIKTYGFTLRKTKLDKGVSKQDYTHQLIRYTRIPGVTVDDYVFETEAGLHTHGIMRIPVHTDFKRFRFRGWNIKLEELWDPQQWVIYMNKHQPDSDDDQPDDDPSEQMPTLKNIFLSNGKAVPYKPPNHLTVTNKDCQISFDNEILLQNNRYVHLKNQFPDEQVLEGVSEGTGSLMI